MNEEYLYEVGQEVWVLFADTRTVRVGKILECMIVIDEFSRTVTYTLQNKNETFSALETDIFLDAPEALDQLLAEMGV